MCRNIFLAASAFLYSVALATKTCQKGRSQLAATYSACPEENITTFCDRTTILDLISRCQDLSQFGCALKTGDEKLSCGVGRGYGHEVCPLDRSPVSRIVLNDNKPVVYNVDLKGDDIQYDVYFLVDARESAGYKLNDVKTQIYRTVLHLKAGSAFGLGFFRDESELENGFSHLRGMTTQTGELFQSLETKLFFEPELEENGALLPAMYKVATSSEIGWRKNSRRIIMYLGTRSGHEPSCGPHGRLTRNSVVDKLNLKGISIFAVDFGGMNKPAKSYNCRNAARRKSKDSQAAEISNWTRGTIVFAEDFMGAEEQLYDVIMKTFNRNPVLFESEYSTCGDKVIVEDPFPIVVQTGATENVKSIVKADLTFCIRDRAFDCQVRYFGNGKLVNVVDVSVCRA